MEDGWNIRANRLGTAVVELAYIDISGEVQHYSYKIDVNEDKFTLELNPDENVRLHMEYDETVCFQIFQQPVNINGVNML